MIKYFPFLLLFLVACNNDQSSKDRPAYDTAETEDANIDPLKQEIVSAFPEVYQFFSSRDASFNAGNFEEMSTDTSLSPPLQISPSLKDYYPYLIYNSDSTYAIDLYSYNFMLEKRNGKTVAEAAGPDTEVGLIDFKNKTQRRVYFGGTSAAVLDAKWINDQEFFLLTGQIIGDTKFQPELLKYTVTSNQLTDFIYADTLNVQIADYSDKRLKNQ